jgi:hypothetical protein
MEYAVISPPQGFDAVVRSGCNWHMVLGQELVRSTETFLFYKHRSYERHFIMVDNGAAEPKHERLPFPLIAKVALALGPAEITMPDVLRDGPATLESTLDKEAMALVPAKQRIVIPQGRTWTEWETCMELLTKTLEFNTLGIAKHLEQLPGGRLTALRILARKPYAHDYDIHLFGVWTHPLAELNAAHCGPLRIRSFDTAAAIAYAQHGAPIADDNHFSVDWKAPVDLDMAEFNIGVLRSFNARNTEPSTGPGKVDNVR